MKTQKNNKSKIAIILGIVIVVIIAIVFVIYMNNDDTLTEGKKNQLKNKMSEIAIEYYDDVYGKYDDGFMQMVGSVDITLASMREHGIDISQFEKYHISTLRSYVTVDSNKNTTVNLITK